MDKYIAGKICKIDDMDEFLGIIAAFYWGFAMDLMREFLGFGVAGNFANHLEQAGEADDFADIISDEKDEPKGIFPFYIPRSKTYLGRFCICNDEIILPENKELKVQAEPEVGLECEIIYDNYRVAQIKPLYFMAFNDASVRNDRSAIKLSQKKNFSIGSKAIGHKKIPIDVFEKGGICDDFSIASFIESNGFLEFYGEVSPLNGYSYFYSKLLDWMVLKLNTQQDFSVPDSLGNILQESQYPKHALFAIGATRYMPQNEKRFLQSGDRIIIVVFNHKQYSLKDIQLIASQDCIPSDLEDISIINQKVVLQ